MFHLVAGDGRIGEFESPGSPGSRWLYLGAANNKILPRFRHAIEEEAWELSDFARAFKAAQAFPDVFDRPINDLNAILQAVPSPAEAEAALEVCGRLCGSHRRPALSLHPPCRALSHEDFR